MNQLGESKVPAAVAFQASPLLAVRRSPCLPAQHRQQVSFLEPPLREPLNSK
jgi:hypothetical protein